MARFWSFLAIVLFVHFTVLHAMAQNSATTSPTFLNFAAQLIGTQSASQRVILINNGTTPISVSSVSTSGDFILTSNRCLNGVKPGTHCDVSVAYSPTAAGSASGTLTFVDTASNSPQVVPLQGIPSALSVSPASLNFGNVVVGNTGLPQYVTLTNLGLSSVSFSSIAASGYFYGSNTCGSILIAGATCLVPVTFSPLEGFWAYGNLTIVDSDPLSPQLVNLSGYGVANPTPTLSNPLVPDHAAVGSSGITLVVNGAGFAPTSMLYWNGAPRVTTFISASKLQAAIPASDLVAEGTALVSVANPDPEGGTSNKLPFTINVSTASVSFARTDYPVGVGPTSITTADLNNDSFLDLVVANNGGGSVSVLTGKGDGTFTPHVDYSVPAKYLAIGDFNEDGALDVAVVRDGVGGGSSNPNSILLGNGDGTLQPPVTFSTWASGLAVGDFNNDGELDIITLRANGTQSSGVLYLGNGDGGFNVGPSFYGGVLGQSPVAGDFNGDGNLDVVTIPDPTLNAFAVLLGDGKGNLSLLGSFNTGGTNPQALAVADLNHDGIMDVVVMNNGTNTVAVLLGKGDGTFGTPVVYGTGGSSPSAVAVADMNGDGKPDIVVLNHANSFTVLFGKGDGTFPKSKTFKTGNYPKDLVIGDFNRDGHLDVAVANWGSNTISIFLQAPSVTLKPPSLAFGTQAVGTTGYPQMVTVSNTGSADLDISGYTFAGNDASDFSVTNSYCPAVLGPKKQCYVYISFDPHATGARSATFSLNSNAKTGSKVSLTGTGI